MGMEQIQHMMERLLEKLDAKEEARRKELREAMKGNQERMEVLLEGLRSCGRGGDGL
jgi:hypothetical protein